jgi:hypothetical protein
MFIICKSIFKITGDPILCWATCSTPRFMLTGDSHLWWTSDVTPMVFFKTICVIFFRFVLALCIYCQFFCIWFTPLLSTFLTIGYRVWITNLIIIVKPILITIITKSKQLYLLLNTSFEKNGNCSSNICVG